MVGSVDSEDGESVSVIPDVVVFVVEVGPGDSDSVSIIPDGVVVVVKVSLGDAVGSVCLVVAEVDAGEIELDVQFSTPTRDAVAPKRSDLMKFMQYAKDPTVEVLTHSFFLLLASSVAFVKFLQSAGTVALHLFKGLSF